MFRKFLAIVILVGLVAGVWYATRLIKHDKDLDATIIFDSDGGLGKGAAVTLHGNPVGTVTAVTRLGGKAAAVVHIERDHRNEIRSDSLFEITGDPPDVSIRVINSIAVGAPVEYGAVIIARRDRLTRFLARGGEKLAPSIEAAKGRAKDWYEDFTNEKFDAQLREWETKVPEWKAQGKDVYAKNMDEMKRQVETLERNLRRLSRSAEADKLHETFDRWVEKVSKD